MAEGHFKLNSTSALAIKGILFNEELAKVIALLLNCKLMVISVCNIAGFALKTSSSLKFAQKFLYPERNFVFINNSLRFAAVLKTFLFFAVFAFFNFSHTHIQHVIWC